MCFFFFTDTATTEIYTLSLHDALPIYLSKQQQVSEIMRQMLTQDQTAGQYLAHNLGDRKSGFSRNAETDIVCRLLLEKKKSAETRALPSDVMTATWITNSVRPSTCAPS